MLRFAPNCQYDGIIIGAGIAGLVCGCYLAKRGMKMLILEQHSKPGGCCQSFTQDGFTFDVGVHGFGALQENGRLREVFNDLDLSKNIEIVKVEPSDILILPEGEICIWSELKKTIAEFQEKFPDEAKNIASFFNYVSNTDFMKLYMSLRDKKFIELLDEYFNNSRLKSVLGIPLGNLGVSYKQISALLAIMLYKEFMLGGGYYPKTGGVQALPNALLKRFKELGGVILLSQKVRNICVKNNAATGVMIDEDRFIGSRFVVSACDARETYLNLIGAEQIPRELDKMLNTLLPSISTFVVHLGLQEAFRDVFNKRCTGLWHFPSSQLDVDKIYLHNQDINDIYYMGEEPCVFCSLSRVAVSDGLKSSMHLLVSAPFMNKRFWEENKFAVADDLIRRLEYSFPDFKKYIAAKTITTPYHFFKYTGNYKGSAYGWAALATQTKRGLVSMASPIRNLFLCGHWVPSEFGSGGISTVAYIGKKASELILKSIC